MSALTIAIIAVASFLGLVLILLLLINHFFYRMFKVRNDGDSRYKFLTLNDYPGLIKKDVSVQSVYKVKLNGGVFFYKNKVKHHGVIIFYHGFLSGYVNYLNVINYFAKANFIVVAFDMYGNMTSEGKNMKGFAHGDKDNKRIIDFVKNNPELNQYPLFTLGHSWGAHVAITSLFHDDVAIKKVAALSPFNSNVDVTYSTASGLKVFAPLIYLLNLFKFGHESTYSVVGALKYTSADVMIFCGGADEIIKPAYSYRQYQKTKNKYQFDNVVINYYPNRKHFLYLSDRAEQYFTKEISFPRSAPIDFAHLDYSLVNEIDEKILKEIVDFFLK